MADLDRKRRIAAVLGVLAEAYRQKITPVTIKAYEIGLEGVPVEAIEQATQKALAQCKFLPVPAELRKLAGEMSHEHRAALAWEAFLEAVSRHGYYVSVDFDDAAINATAHNLGGWTSLIERLDEEDAKWIRKDFERIYLGFVCSGVEPSQARALIGWCDKQNAASGHHDAVRKPERITTGLPATRPQLPDSHGSGEMKLLEGIGKETP